MDSCAKCSARTDTAVKCVGCQYPFCAECMPADRCETCMAAQGPVDAPEVADAAMQRAVTAILSSTAFAMAIQTAVEAALGQVSATAALDRTGSSPSTRGRILSSAAPPPSPRGHPAPETASPSHVAVPSPEPVPVPVSAPVPAPCASTKLLPCIGYPSGTITTGATLTSSVWNKSATIQAIEDSIRLTPLTKEQRNYRANNTTLPEIDDDCFQWFVFNAAFVETTEKCKFTATENLIRLRAAIKGDALTDVAHLLSLPNQVDKIMETLRIKFTRPRKLLETARRLAKEAPRLRANLDNCTTFFVQVQRVSLTLDLLTHPYAATDVLEELESHLPTDIAREWIERHPLDDGDMADFVTFIGGLADVARRLPKPPTRREHVHFADVKTSPCPACKDTHEHHLENCPNLLTMSTPQRWAVVRRNKLCFNCLAGDHLRRDCSLPSQCQVASCGKHHRILHHVHAQVHFARVPTPNNKALYRVVPVTVSVAEKSVDTYALMDDGSSATLIAQGLADELGVSGAKMDVMVSGTDGRGRLTKTQQVTVQIRAQGQERAYVLSGLTTNNLQLPQCSLTSHDLSEGGFEKLPIPLYSDVVPRLLIGLDNPHVTVSEQSVLSANGGMVATKSPLGWTVKGRRGAVQAQERVMFVLHAPIDHQLDQVISEYIDAENFGLIPDECVPLESREDQSARQLLAREMIYNGERYVTPLLWKETAPKIPCNYSMALKRHRAFLSKLKRDKDAFAQVASVMRDYESRGYISRVSSTDVNPQFSKNHFLPIFTVSSPSKPGKLRVVWDAAAEFQDVSLNSMLNTGPDLTVSLVHVLMRFRVGRVAIAGDIEQMFMQVEVKEEDRVALQFLFVDEDGKDALYQANRLPFGLACSPACAQFAKNQNATRFVSEFPEVWFEIVWNTFMDDWLGSFNTEEAAIQRALDVRAVHASGGFNMRKWSSNSPRVLAALDVLPGPEQTESLEHLLGLLSPTKRQVVQLAMSLFDPLGLAAFVTIVPRILMREVWRYILDWDEPLPEELVTTWIRTVDVVRSITRLRVPRWHGTLNTTVDLHVFCDASLTAIAAVVYIAFVQDGETKTSLVTAKAKVAPLKSLSVPRLELEAAVLGVRLLETVRSSNAWECLRITMWSDALDVLYWVRNHRRRYNQFVANRVGDILRTTAADQWRWVSSEQNPADWATKWDDRSDLRLWWQGPAFLHEEEASWPVCQDKPDVVLEEVRVMVVKIAHRPVWIPDPERFSSWSTFLRNAATVRAVTAVLRHNRERGPLTPHEEEATRLEILRWVQEDLTDLRRRPFLKMAPFQDPADGLWRMRGRTWHAEFLPYDERCPVILPRGHPVTQLLLRHYHELGSHQLIDRALNELRRWYVLERPRAALNAVIKSCPACILQKARPVVPQMAVLPPCRLAVGQRPFSHCGMDAFGPFEVTRLRRKEKWYGILFVCMSSRAIYLELVESLSGESCMKAMDSLAARRGAPAVYYSDNGTNFVYASKRYRDIEGGKPQFVFNPPGAPHMGGSWERLIGLTKRALSSLGLAGPCSEERLRHLFVQAEFLVNTRPLTDVPHDPATTVAITPMMILTGSAGNQPAKECCPSEMLKAKDDCVQEFWRRWVREYLSTISHRPKWFEKVRVLEVGDQVYVCDTDYRQGWRRGRVVQVFAEALTGQVRRAKVEIIDDGQKKVILRPVTRIARLNLQREVDTIPSRTSEEECGMN